MLIDDEEETVRAFIGGALGAVVTVLVLVLEVKVAPLASRDLLSFVLSTVTIVIAAFTVLGAVIVVMTRRNMLCRVRHYLLSSLWRSQIWL